MAPSISLTAWIEPNLNEVFMYRVAFALASVLAVSGCSVNKPFYATGGSRADGTVDMAYDTAYMVTPVVNYGQAENIAAQKCRVWGYKDAESFGGKVENCYQRNGYGNCLRGQVIVKYQCLGSLDTVQPNLAPSPQSKVSAPVPTQMSKEQYKQMQIESLMKKNIPYEEYARQYDMIMAQ